MGSAFGKRGGRAAAKQPPALGERWQLLLVSVATAALSSWALWEQDVFWQVRAGSELMDTLRLQQRDTWSYTAFGSEWHNVEWLSTWLLALVFRAFDVGGLLALRALLSAGLLYLVGASIRAAAPRLAPSLWWSLVAAAFLALAPRLQIRPEMFALLCFAGLLRVWLSALAPRRKRLITLGLVLLTSNFHAGLTPFIGLVAVGFFLGARDARPLVAVGWLLGLFVAAFGNPEPLAGLQHIVVHLFYFGGKVIPNPEQQRLTLEAMLEGPERWALWSWLLLLALSAVWLGQRDPASYGRRTWPRAVSLILALLCLERVRATPFSVLYATPFAAMLLEHWQVGWSAAKRRAIGLACSGGVALVALFWPPYPFGFGLARGLWPVQTVAFIRKTRPQPNIFHTFSFGAYLVAYLPEYKVFGDTREVPFRGLEAEYQAAFESKAGLEALVRKFDINALLLATPPTERLDDSSGYLDVLEAYAPSTSWALVQFDEASVLLLRRTEQNATIIAEHEYRWLRPGMPPSEIQRVAGVNPNYAQALQQEVARCLSDVPGLRYCEELAKLGDHQN